jgi:hypothetical protein
MAKPLADEAIDQDPHLLSRGLDAFLLCRAAVVSIGPYLHGRGGPPSPQADRVVLTQTEPSAAGPAALGLPTLVSYGYAPERATLLLPTHSLLDGCFAVITRPGRTPGLHPAFNAVVYTLDVLISALALVLANDWDPQGKQRLAMAANSARHMAGACPLRAHQQGRWAIAAVITKDRVNRRRSRHRQVRPD